MKPPATLSPTAAAYGRREAMAARDEHEQQGERDPARDARAVDLGGQVAALSDVVQRVEDVRGGEQERGATERGAGQRPHRYERARSSTSGLTGVLGGSPFSVATAFSAARTPIAVRVSIVAEPRWGRSTTLSSSSSPGWVSGSFS
jgi:hypothetical protein